MKIAVGTTNPAKLKAVEAALAVLFPDEPYQVLGVEVESGVSDQPMSDTESVTGAYNRAHAACTAVDNADYGIGLEGGLEQVGDIWFTGNIACVVSDTKSGYGMSAKAMIPKKIMSEVQKGHELSDAVHTVTGIQGTGKKQGLLGYVTNGHITRQSASKEAIIAAFSSVLSS